MKRNLSILFILVLLYNSCSTDFDVVAPYKEIMVIDGLLNADDTVQNIRISKAFLGEGNAYVMAQQKDSVNYADVLDVTMEKLGGVPETFTLTRNELDTGIFAKDSGIFAYPFHVLYTTNHPIVADGSEYKLIVKNRQTGVTAYSQTKIVKKIFKVTSPLPLPSPTGDSIDLATSSQAPAYIIYEPGQGSNAQVFDAIIRFHYREIDPSGNSKQYYIDYNFSDKVSNVAPSEINYRYYKYNIFDNIGFNIPDKAGYTRRIDSLSPAGLRPFQYILIEGTEDLLTYSQLQHPSSSSVIDEPPTFTTVVNGLGLFTSRILHSMYYYPTAVTEAAFDTAAATKHKNFKFD